MLQYLFSPTKQFTYESGKLLDGGKIYVYIKDTTILATLYDVDEDYVSNPIILDANGRASVKADDAYEYRLEIYTNKDVLLYTCNAFCDGGTGDGGLSVVRHDETLSGNGTSQSLLGVINMPLAVDDTMTAYTATVEEKESLVLGVNGDWFTDTFGSALNDKVDWSSFSACCSAVKGGLANKLDISSFDLGNYYNKQEINSALDLKLDVSEFYNNISGFQTELLFSYSPSNEISAINYSGLYNPWISAAKVLAPTQTLQPGQWFQVLSSVDVSGERNHCVGLKGGSYTFPTVNDFYNWLDLQQYVTFDVYNAGTGALNNAIHVAYSGINNLYNSAYYLLNNKLDISAYSGTSGGDETPWISGAKILADTQTLTDNMIVQVLSSFTLSGNKNHCIAVKGGTYRFPNAYELGDRIATTNFFMATSSMSSYLPVSSFSSYTASIQNNLNSNWDYTNSAYSLSINNFYNKLDASAFSAYTADAGETYTLVGGDNISISSDDEEKTTTISVTGEVGDTTPWISGAKILSETKYMEPGEYIQVLSSFTLSGNKNHCIAVKGGGYYFPTNYMLASGISSSLTGVFVPSSTFSSFVSSWSDHLSTLYGNDSYLSSCVSNISANKLDASSYHELTAGTNIDIQNYVISSKDWTNEIKEASANAFNEATAANPTSSTQWNSCYETVNTNSGEWNKVSSKLDSTAFEAYTANDETYLLKGGYNIGVSSDDVNKETTIYYTGTNGDEQVNQVVRQYSAAGTWLTSHQDWTNTITAASAYAYNQATAHEPDMSLYVPMSAVSALIDVVQTYSGKWLLNGDL